MSHVTTIDAKEFYDILSLKRMCENQGWEFIEGKETFAWFGRHVGDFPIPEGFEAKDMGRCSHAINIPGCRYEVGVVRKNDKWVLLYDFYSPGGLKTRLGENAGLLKQTYNIAKTQVTCRAHARGWTQGAVKGREGWQELTVNMGGW